MKRIGNWINRLRHMKRPLMPLFIFAAAFVAFAVLRPSLVTTLEISAAAWLAVLAVYPPRKSYPQFLRLAAAALAVELALLLEKRVRAGALPPMQPRHWAHILYLAALGASLAFLALRAGKARDGAPTLPELYPERERDRLRVLDYLERFDRIGIDGAWGSGKTLLMNTLKADETLRDRYIFITIPLLSCNLDELTAILLQEIDRALRQNGVFSFHSSQLRGALEGNAVLKALGGAVLQRNQTYTEAMLGFVGDIRRVGKTIVIDFEDIDRVSDGATIRKIFSIAEGLTEGGGAIKVVYEYSQQDLEAVDAAFDRAFVEKYIPFTVRLTEASFEATLRRVLDGGRHAGAGLALEDFRFLWLPVQSASLNARLRGFPQLTQQIAGVSVRKVEHFLDEIASLRGGVRMDDALERRALIVFCLIKHFDWKVFEGLDLWASLPEQFPVTRDGEDMTVPELLNRCDKGEIPADEAIGVLNQPENRKSVAYLALFGYDLSASPEGHGLLDAIGVPEARLAAAQRNERIDRLVRRLVASGKSAYTDWEAMARRLEETVLSRPEAEQADAFGAFMGLCCQEAFDDLRDNRTPFRVGVSPDNTIFQALAACKKGDDLWLRYLDFYFRRRQGGRIDLYLVANLTYCPAYDVGVYMAVLRAFNRLEVVGNMNRQPLYWRFLIKYISAMGAFFADAAWAIRALREDDCEGNPDLVTRLLFPRLRRQLAALRETLSRGGVPMDSASADVGEALAFVEKNAQIIGAERPVPTPDGMPRVETRYMEAPVSDAILELMAIEDEAARLKAADALCASRRVTVRELVRAGIVRGEQP